MAWHGEDETWAGTGRFMGGWDMHIKEAKEVQERRALTG